MRDTKGKFIAGHSGNPGGRPKDEFKVAEFARSHTVEAVETLVDLMRYSKDDRVRGTASQALLDRGWGKVKVGGRTMLCSTVLSNRNDNYVSDLRLFIV